MTKTRWSAAAVLLLLIVGVWLTWNWVFCRFYVNAGYMAVVISKQGETLPPGQILAKPGQQGIQEKVLGEGRHFLNPYLYEHEIVPMLEIPSGKVGLVTSKIGAELPGGEFLADEGQKGIWKKVLGPGRYRLNPYGYQVDVIDAVSIPVGYVGVITSLSGGKAPEGLFAGKNQKGIRSQVLQPGLYYVNPKQFKVDVLEIGLNQVSLLGKAGGEVLTKSLMSSDNAALNQLNLNVLREQQAKREDFVQKQQAQMEQPQIPRSAPSRPAGRAQPPGRQAAAPSAQPFSPSFVLSQFVEFPSRDGFEISLDMTLEFELAPVDIPRIYRDYGDLTVVVDNIIMPQLLSISRLKGSAFRATDFIVGEGREKFQNDLTEAIKLALKTKGISVHNALIRHVNVPDEILQPIQLASAAKEQDLTNKEKQNTARKQGELNTELGLIDQSKQQVDQETSKLKAEVRADQEKQVAQIQAETFKAVALVAKQIAAVRADQTRTLGQATAEVTRRVEGEKAKGFGLKVSAFGDPSAYNLYEFAKHLNEQVQINILHAGPGTLWTDLKGAQMGNLGAAEILKSSQNPKTSP